MTCIYHHKHYELAFFPYETSIKIRILDAKNARCFESEFTDSSSQSLSKSLCLNSKDLFSLIVRALTSSNDLLSLEILSMGTISIRIILQFPIEKLMEFNIPLKELELNDFRKGLYQMQDLEGRLSNIEAYFKKEELKIRKNSHFPSFETQSPNITNSYTFTNKRKTANKVKDSEGEILEGTKLEKMTDSNFIKFSVVFKGNTSIINGFIGVGFEKETGINKKGSYLMGSGVVYWDGTIFNSNSLIRNNEEISVIISEAEETIRWENKEGEKLFVGRFMKQNITSGLGIFRPLISAANAETSISFL